MQVLEGQVQQQEAVAVQQQQQQLAAATADCDQLRARVQVLQGQVQQLQAAGTEAVRQQQRLWGSAGLRLADICAGYVGVQHSTPCEL